MQFVVADFDQHFELALGLAQLAITFLGCGRESFFWCQKLTQPLRTYRNRVVAFRERHYFYAERALLELTGDGLSSFLARLVAIETEPNFRNLLASQQAQESIIQALHATQRDHLSNAGGVNRERIQYAFDQPYASRPPSHIADPARLLRGA